MAKQSSLWASVANKALDNFAPPAAAAASTLQ